MGSQSIASYFLAQNTVLNSLERIENARTSILAAYPLERYDGICNHSKASEVSPPVPSRTNFLLIDDISANLLEYLGTKAISDEIE